MRLPRRPFSAMLRLLVAMMFALTSIIGGSSGVAGHAAGYAAGHAHAGVHAAHIGASDDQIRVYAGANAHAQHDCCEPEPTTTSCLQACAMLGCSSLFMAPATEDAQRSCGSAVWASLATTPPGTGPETATPPPRRL
jgi:hypothetical protein